MPRPEERDLRYAAPCRAGRSDRDQGSFVERLAARICRRPCPCRGDEMGGATLVVASCCYRLLASLAMGLADILGY